MMNNNAPLPKYHKIYIILIFLCAVVLFVNIYRTDTWTGDKPFSDFSDEDWKSFYIFIAEELLIVFVLFAISVIFVRNSRINQQKIMTNFEEKEYIDIKPGDYDYVWLDSTRTKRALIFKKENSYRVYVHQYDKNMECWIELNQVSIFNNLDELKKSLLRDYGFKCDDL